jgi:hypothetical protein
VTKRQKVMSLAWREYVPLAMMVAMWALIVLILGHADTARLLAGSLMIRGLQMLVRVSTGPSLRSRIGADPAVRRKSLRLAVFAQGASLCIGLLLVVGLILALQAIGQDQVAFFLPLIAIGMPARIFRNTDVRTGSPYYRLALTAGGLLGVALGWAIGWHAVGIGLAFGARDWFAYAALRLWPKAPHVPKRPLTDPLDFAEIARNSAISARRLLTYRLTKVALAVFGPAGNFAARTGRGLNWHNKIEPYLPHKFSGFMLFALGAGGAAVALAARVGEPAAMVAAGGLLQLAGAAGNILMMWPYLPNRDDPNLLIDDDEDE